MRTAGTMSSRLSSISGVDARFIELTVEKDLLSVQATHGWVPATAIG